MGESEELLTLKAAAFEAGVTTQTLRRWIKADKLEALRVGPTGRLRVRADVLADAMRPRPHGQG